MQVRTSARKMFVHSVPRAAKVENEEASSFSPVEDQELFAVPQVKVSEPFSLISLLKKRHKISLRKYQAVLTTLAFNFLLVVAWNNPVRFAIANGITGGVLLIVLIQTLKGRKALQTNIIESIRSIRQTTTIPEGRTESMIQERLLRLKGWQVQTEPSLLTTLKKAGVVKQRHQNLIINARKLSSEFTLLAALVCGFGIGFDSIPFFSLVVLAGLFYLVPSLYFSRIADQRADEARYLLPLFAQQIVITTSGGLDIGTSLKDIYETAVSRQRGNILMNHVGNILICKMGAGLSLAEALTEESRECGIDEVKRFFRTLSSTVESGTELYRSMAATAEQAEMMRFIEIEDRVRRLPIHATGALFLVFAGFFAVISAGLVSYISEAIKFL